MNDSKLLFDQLLSLETERRNKRSSNIDSLSIMEILRVINNEDRQVPQAIAKELRHVAKAVRLLVRAFQTCGRLIYVGAGTSGRLGVLDAAECPPTFGTDPGLIQGIIAGGKEAMHRSIEGAEDKEGDGASAIRRKKVSAKDVVCGIAASSRTPFVIGAIREAKKRGAKTIFITTNPRSSLKRNGITGLTKLIDVAICPEVGPEVIMGSTRMKSGTAQKLVLNMITTTAMIRLGKVYSNMMVDLKMNSRKLKERAKRVLMIVTGVDYRTAGCALNEAGGHVKTAIVMLIADVPASVARARLRKARGFVRNAIERS